MKEKITLSLLILIGTYKTVLEVTWNTEMLSTTSCQGNNKLLMWNYTIGENESVIELQWFFNESKLICLYSKTVGFLVEPLYEGRVELKGTMGILLKNISLDDMGKYTLHVKLDEEKEENIQSLFLTIFVPYQCKPVIELHSQNVVYCSTSSCKRSEYSPEWIINGTQDPQVNIGQYLKINESISKQAFCCLLDLKCHDEDRFKFCLPYHISLIGSTSSEDNNTRHFEKGTTNEVAGNQMLIIIFLLILLVVLFVLKMAYSFLLRRFKPLCPNLKCTEDPQQVDIAAGTTDNTDLPETTTEPPDATSEPLVHHDGFGSIRSSFHQATSNDYETMNEHNQM